MVRFVNRWGWLLSGAAAAAIYALLPLRDALQFGEDEGFEVMKAFLCLKGFRLYQDIWNDQPPVFTALLTEVFRWFGPTMLAARSLAAGFGVALVVCLYRLVQIRSGGWPGWRRPSCSWGRRCFCL
jgi:hypothetical protein